MLKRARWRPRAGMLVPPWALEVTNVGSRESAPIEMDFQGWSAGGRASTVPVVSGGVSPRYRFNPYTAPHDNNTPMINAPAVAVIKSRLLELSNPASRNCSLGGHIDTDFPTIGNVQIGAWNNSRAARKPLERV